MQPIASPQYKVIAGTAAGTAVLLDRPGSLFRVFVPANRTGTVEFYDCATAAGTSDANNLCSVACTVGTIPTSIEMQCNLNKGLVYISGGTTRLTVVYE